MIAEIPAPDCVSAGPFKTAIAVARTAFDARFQPGPNCQAANLTVTLQGVGFFDWLHGQRGVAPLGIELHPNISISFQGPEGKSWTGRRGR